jgi:hypothetical protein
MSGMADRPEWVQAVPLWLLTGGCVYVLAWVGFLWVLDRMRVNREGKGLPSHTDWSDEGYDA